MAIKDILLPANDILCDTYPMDKVTELDKPAHFEPMQNEALERQARDFPLNQPLSEVERQKAVDWLLNPNGGGVYLNLQKPYDNPETKKVVAESLLLNSWFLPSNELGNEIPMKGSSGHEVSSTTVPITIDGDNPRRLDLVIKPRGSKPAKAVNEIEKFNEARNRGIKTVEPLGVLGINDNIGHDTYVLTLLRKGLIPLQKVNFEQLNGDRNFTQLTQTLETLAQFVANMHNKGIVHGDLHTGNFAIDLDQEAPDRFVVFDMEQSTIMAKDKLGIKNKPGQETSKAHAVKFRKFETLALKDVAELVADVKARNENIPYDVLLHNFVIPYLRARQQSHGIFPDEEFIAKFDQKYKGRLKAVRSYVQHNRENLANLEPKATS